MAKTGAALVAALMLIVSWRVVGRMMSRFLRFWRALPMLGKVVLPVCLTVFYLHGSTKQKGAPKSEAPAVSPSSENVVAGEAEFVQPLHRYLAPTNFAADLSIFNRPTNAVTPRLWRKYTVSDDFQLVPGKRIAGVCGAVTTQPWGIDTPDRIKDIYETYAPLYSTNALIRGVSDFWTVTNEFSQIYVWKDLAHKCNKTNLISFAVTLYDWGDIEFTYGNVPTEGFTSFVKLKDRTLDLTGNVAPNRMVRVEKNFEQDTEWWLENYPEICYTNATGDLVFDYDTNEWIYVEFTFGATEPMAEYNKALNDYRLAVSEAIDLSCRDKSERYLPGLESWLDKYDKECMSPEMLKQYEPLFKTVTNITDAVTEVYIAYVWDERNGEKFNFDLGEKARYYDKIGSQKFPNSGVSATLIYTQMGGYKNLSLLDRIEKIKIDEWCGAKTGSSTNFYVISYSDLYLVKNILGPKPKLQDYYKRLSPYLEKKNGDIISPEFYMDFPLGKFVWLYYNDSQIRVKNDREKPNIGAFLQVGYVHKVIAEASCQSITNPKDIIQVEKVKHTLPCVYRLTPRVSMSLENVDFSTKNWVNAKAKITPELKHGSYSWSISENLEMIKSIGNQVAILRKNGESGWVKCVWDNGDKAFWNLRMSNTVYVASNESNFNDLPKFLSITPSSSFLVCPEEHLDKNGNMVYASGTNVMLTCSYGGQQAGTVELRLDYDLAGEVYENGIRRQLPYRWEVPGGQVTTKILEIRDLWPSGEYKFNLLFTSEKLPEGFMQQASVKVMKLDIEADRIWPEMRKRHVFGPNEPFTVTVDDDSETIIIAPKIPGTYTTNVTCNGYSIPFSYSVIAPSHCIATNAYPMADSDWAEVGVTNSLSVGEVGAGMCLELKILPEHVSFEGLKIMEGECSATSAWGCYLGVDMSQMGHKEKNGAYRKILVGRGNTAGIDRAAYYENPDKIPKPWSIGGYQWNIPENWSADDFVTTNRFTTNVQRFQFFPTGEFEVSKFGWTAHRSMNGNQTITRDAE